MKTTLLALILSAVMFAACEVESIKNAEPIPPSKSDQELILEAEGYENIKMTGTPLFVCSEDDSVFFNKGFRATKNGKTFEGAVCGAFLKGHTVRISKVK